MISPLVIQSVLDASRIEEVVGDFVNLKRRGANLLGHCPFHNEKTPSFIVSPSKGIFKCFGCGKAGNSLKFIMEHEKLAYPEAIRFLAKKYGIEIEEKELSPEEKAVLDERESLLAVNTFAAAHFSKNLHETEEGKAIGLSYLKERGFTNETIKKFGLGYSPEKWEDLTEAALKEGYKLEFLEKTGLTVVRDDKHFDRFRNRVIFPIHSLSGRIIGFGGRVLISDPQKAKYLNSPESEIYHKGATLYGIHFARTAIASRDECLLVEGYTDVLSLHQAGFENVVASSGTSLTTEQVKLIKRFTPNITILYDGDEAGIKASFRGIDMVLEQGMNVKIVLFPDGEDPDSFVRKNRQVEVIEFIKKNAVNFILFKTRLLLKEAGDDPIRKAQLIKEIVQSIALIPDPIYRNSYIKECSSLMGVSEISLVNELNKVLRRKFIKKNTENDENPPDLPEIQPEAESQVIFDINDTEFQEEYIMHLLLNYANELIHTADETEDTQAETIRVADFIIYDLVKDEIGFDNAAFQLMFNEYFEALKDDNVLDDQHFINHPQEDLSIAVIDLLNTPYTISLNWQKKGIDITTEKDVLSEAVTSSILAFKLKRLQKMIQDNDQQIKTATAGQIDDLLRQKIILDNAKKELAIRLGRVILW